MPPNVAPPAFTPIPNRDAAAAIRGFVYQVETTVLRWLDLHDLHDLQDGEILELERGEDIDLIGDALGAAGVAADTVRTLEQVTRETAPMTLRSGGARAAVISEKSCNGCAVITATRVW